MDLLVVYCEYEFIGGWNRNISLFNVPFRVGGNKISRGILNDDRFLN